ncbi:MAG TPA: VOC family protein [Polyangia bacterium]|nr:VOC family protein [Polyangia bacterium]
MGTKGIDGILVETHNWGATVAFWKGLGYELEFETDHHSGRLRHPAGGPYIFVAERAAGRPLQMVLGVAVADAGKFRPPPSGAVVRPFEEQHWPALQMLLADPDGRPIAVEAPLPRTRKPAVRRARRPARKR